MKSSRTNILFALLILFSCGSSLRYTIPSEPRANVVTGLEEFIENYADEYKGKRAAVITNHSGVDHNLRQNIELFKKEGIIVGALFAPEHGLYGFVDWPVHEKIEKESDDVMAVYQIQNHSPEALHEILSKFDLVIFDIQDMGMRCYTYISELTCVIDALDGTKTRLVVLDRPNPLILFGVDGIMLDKKFKSRTVSYFPGPTNYGLTIGEAALYYKGETHRKTDIEVIPMKHYSRDLYYSETSLPWIPPSPNLPSYKNALIYSAIVYCEGINISVGRGTPNPFEYIGAPWIDPAKLSSGLNSLNLSGFTFRPVYFMPSAYKYKGQRCGGVQIFLNGESFSACETAYKIILFIKENYSEFRWKNDSNGEYGIDFIVGSDLFRKGIDNSTPYNEILSQTENSRLAFEEKIEDYYLY